jgi:hypothetical protein
MSRRQPFLDARFVHKNTLSVVLLFKVQKVTDDMIAAVNALLDSKNSEISSAAKDDDA